MLGGILGGCNCSKCPDLVYGEFSGQWCNSCLSSRLGGRCVIRDPVEVLSQFTDVRLRQIQGFDCAVNILPGLLEGICGTGY